MIGERLRLWYRKCWACDGTGLKTVKGERIPDEELTAQQVGERLVLGGWYYRAVKVPCGKCGGSGVRRSITS